MQKLGLANNFWVGHQGWEYVDIGRFWQAFLFVGLMVWLLLVGRALWPALTRRDEMSSIVGLLFLSTVALGMVYGAGLMWGEHTPLAMVEYWRWRSEERRVGKECVILGDLGSRGLIK